jgi:hypothetical protein
LLIKIGEAKKEAGRAFGLVDLKLPDPGRSTKRKPKTKRPKAKKPKTKLNFSFRVNRAKFRETYRREGQYLLRSNLSQQAPARLWEYYTLLTEIEEAFKNLKGDLGIRPIFHQLPHRIEAHVFIAFLSYCLHVTLRRRLRDLAPGLTPRAVLEKFSPMQMIDVHLPTTDDRTIILSRYTPARGRPSTPAQTTQTGITRSAAAQNHGLRTTGPIGLCSEDFLGVYVDFKRLTIDVPLESAKSG